MVRRVLKGLLKKKVVKRGLIALLIGVIVAGLFAGGVVPLNIGQPPLDFDIITDRLQFGTWEGKGSLRLDELADSIQYISGETKEGTITSEKVVVAAQVQKFSPSFQCVVDLKYEYYFTSGQSWGEPDRVFHPQQSSSGTIGWIIIKTDIWHGLPPASGYLRVQFWIHLNDFCGVLNTDMGWGLVAQDDAYVRYGGSELSFDQTQYEVGETAAIHYKVGFAQSGKTEDALSSAGWTFTLFSFAQDRQVHSETIEGPAPGGTNTIAEGTIWYTVQPEDFRSGGCSVGSNNKLEATLFNNLVFTESETSTTIDSRALAPSAPSITANKAQFVVGDSITLQIVGSPNGETGAPICGANLQILYGNVELIDTNLVGSAVEYTYNNLPDAGLLVVKAFIWDENGRTSEIASASFRVIDPEAEEEPIDIFWIVLIMIVLAVLSFVIWIPMVPIPPAAKIWISIAAWGVILGMVIYFFIVPIVVNFFSNLFKLPGT